MGDCRHNHQERGQGQGHADEVTRPVLAQRAELSTPAGDGAMHYEGLADMPADAQGRSHGDDRCT
jgi:hypothetical protein